MDNISEIANKHGELQLKHIKFKQQNADLISALRVLVEKVDHYNEYEFGSGGLYQEIEFMKRDFAAAQNSPELKKVKGLLK